MKFKEMFRKSVIILMSLCVLLVSNLFGQVCNNNTPKQFLNLGAEFSQFKVYPSMAPRAYVKVGYQTLQQGIFGFDESKLENFIIVKDGEEVSKKFKIDKFYPHGLNKYLAFNAAKYGLKKGDKLNIGLCGTINNQAVLFWDTEDSDSEIRRPVPVPEIDKYTLTVTPDIVPDQELIDETKRTVGQVKLKLDVPSLVENDNVARFYFNTDNSISTDWKDKESKVEMKFGAERNLTDKWFIPVNLETKFNGDQRFKNATFVASSGLKTNLPWGWTRKALFNPLIRAPVSPEFGLSAEYHRRLRQDADSLVKFPKKDSFALAGEFNWLPIQLFTKSCKSEAFGEDIDKCFNSQNVSFEVNAKGWWFPKEETISGTKVSKFEGRVVTSLLIPFSSSIRNQFFFRKKDSAPFTQRLRIKYVTGANDATGFKRSSQFTVGIELIP